MADRNNNSAKVYNMSQPPSDDDAGAPPAPPGGRGGPPARQKRKKKVDAGKLQTLFRRWVFQFASQIVWDTETLQPYALAFFAVFRLYAIKYPRLHSPTTTERQHKDVVASFQLVKKIVRPIKRINFQ
jgi:hypothetical protein